MTPFLQQVARHYHPQEGLEKTCFIFPNRRALTFFTKYLGKEAAAKGAPMVAPSMFTMNDFFYRACGMEKTDRINLLLKLYDCYKALNPKAEPLDDFIFWGDVLLADFNDVDKYLVDAKQIFTNVSDFKSIQDYQSYLNERQLAALEQFMSHFVRPGKIKESFLQIWEILYRLYESFNSILESEEMCYEGQVYRKLAAMTDSRPASEVLSEAFPESERFVFVGLNALNECERHLMKKMRDAGIAEFCWDYSSKWIKDLQNKSSFFLRDNVVAFPNAFDTDPEGLPSPEINVLSVPSSTGQVKQLHEIFSRISGGRLEDVSINTAVVLPDENLLIPALNSIPGEIRDINVTMGYPVAGSEMWSFIDDIDTMQMHLREKDGKWMFHHRQVRAILSNSVFKTALDEEGHKKASQIIASPRYYISQDDLSGHKIFDAVFKAVVKDPSSTDEAQIRAIEDWQKEVITLIAPSQSPIELDFAREFHLGVGRLRSCHLAIKPATYFRLLSQIMRGASIPYKGEPLKGLQIMGPLETRALDFDNVIILNCNEGVFPRREVSSSFIPPELRKGFGLPTYEYQDAIWAYYFYRMIQRAGKVWLLFDSRTEVSRSGEESRYIKQLEMHFGAKVNRFTAGSAIGHTMDESCIVKTEEDIRVLREERILSASALQNYLSCPAKFYYHTVRKLRAEDEVSESLDAGMLGTVFHGVMEELYSKDSTITRSYLEKTRMDKDGIKSLVRKGILEQLHTFEISGRNIIFEDIICQYVDRALMRDLCLLEANGTDSFKILGLELERYMTIGGFRFKGFIDRLDSFNPGEVRVVDYKTGKVTDDDINIDDDNAQSVVDKLFGEDVKERPKIALQLYLYDLFVKQMKEFRGCTIVNSIYQTGKLFTDDILNVPLSNRFCELMEERLARLLEEIADPGTDFRRTCDSKVCEFCDFKMICGR